MTRLLDIGALVAHLAGRIEALCLELLPQGVREGNEWRVGSVAGEPGRSMAVHLSGDKAGVWCDWAGRPGDRGDALDLVALVLFAGRKAEAIRWARAWLGIDREIDPDTLRIERRRLQEKRGREKAAEARKRGSALALYLSAAPQIAGTAAERYFLGRGIDWGALGRQPRALRFARELVHPETGELAPALLAAITGPTGEMVAIHRTYLEALADGSVVKLRSVKDAKLTLGRYAGAAIRLWRGKSAKALDHAEPGEWVIIGEGIEDVATAVTAYPEYRALVAVSGGNVVRLPPAIEGVILLAQNEDNAAALDALKRTVEGYIEQGKRVRLAVPPADVKDINELAQRMARGTA